ncbi:hypothetical protein P168DRAFT_308444 [Aspergillus campestris IBT 28561]|uniref:Aminoglycoside phosphotransferase domain-containing protein n=1 Tax=Aspergillus campestris (strain IBT 28561) TaxID=1392248 RepID=A0A2I1DEW2_ASPC2|nr:uncharacterized protein P168DRAFT_308444 [Aspergillus campestris IBT 28561]PKY08415.1 hypothetical protein P168DRAFT_308444 [Aspergillus campestris IBT 28561]
MPPLLGGKSACLEAALEDDDKILHRLDYPQKQREFWAYLVSFKNDIEATVAFHLRAKYCQVADEADWMCGSYNVCIPVAVNPPSERRVLLRIPLPYKIGEDNCPGNADEKLRCEVATYIWIHENCPTVPIPTLYGFAFPDGKTFVQVFCVSLFSRLRWHITQTLRSWIGFPKICPYISQKRSTPLKTGYMIISLETTRRQNLFNDLAKIILLLSHIRLPRIGSLTIDNDGLISLTKRPLTLRLQSLENEGIPTIPRDLTYPSVEPYLLDLLQCHDNRIYHQLNAIHDLHDGQEQLAALTMMRGLLHQFISLEYPIILVDEDWHITSLIDLEWACAFPIEMQTPPYWLTGRPVDDIEHGANLETYDKIVNEYMDAFDKEGSFWYFQALHSPKGLLRVFNEHVQRKYCEEHCTQRVFDRTVSPYWCRGAEELIRKKMEEEAVYKNRLRERFMSDDGQG